MRRCCPRSYARAPDGATYESPFQFTETLHRIDVQLRGDRPGPTPAVAHDAEMGKQQQAVRQTVAGCFCSRSIHESSAGLDSKLVINA